jgi:site-specific DNA recombinase
VTYNTIQNSTDSNPTIKEAAIWARVSTHDQVETSIPSQVERCTDLLRRNGYNPTYVFTTNWTSLELSTCYEFQQLYKLIRNKQIGALAVYNRDRLQADAMERLSFLSECQEKGVKPLFYEGAQMLEEDEGKLIEIALAIGKKRSVIRAQMGSKIGLADRAKIDGLPTRKHHIYGYDWKQRLTQLVPNADYDTVKLIFDILLGGARFGAIQRELKNRGISSPTGNSEWNKTSISYIARHPVYAGRYYALRSEAVTPRSRKGNTYGKSSVRRVPLDEAYLIHKIEVLNPPITWAQREQLIQQLEAHQKLAKRNAKREYLLRGFIFCNTHYGKDGKPRRYHGQPDRNSGKWRYSCPVGGCKHPSVLGSLIEEQVKNYVIAALHLNTQDRDELFEEQRDTTTSIQIKKQLSKYRAEYQSKINALSQLEIKHLERQILVDVYDKTKFNLEARCKYLKEAQERLKAELTQLELHNGVASVLAEIKDRFEDFEENLYRLSNEQWRELFTLLNLRVIVHAEDIAGNEHELKVKQRPLCDHCASNEIETYYIPNIFPYCEIRLGLYLRDKLECNIEKETAEKAVQIVFNEPRDV